MGCLLLLQGIFLTRDGTMSLICPALTGGFSTTSATWEAIYCPKCASCSVMSDSLRPYGLQPASLLCPCDSPGTNTRVGCHSLLQGIFLTQGSNPDLLHCRQILYGLNHQGSPIILPSSSSYDMISCLVYGQLNSLNFSLCK